jgi:hypothetical protein
MTSSEAYDVVDELVVAGKPLEVDQFTLNALAMHSYARVCRFDAKPPLVAEVEVKRCGVTHIVRRIPPLAPKPQPVQYEFRGLVCETHGQVAHRRVRIDIRNPSPPGVWECVECVPLPSEV